MSYLYKELRLQQLRAFCAAVEHGGYTAAAKATGYSQPTVHQQIDALGRHFGTPLLRRSGKGIVPTEDGRLLYDLVKPLVIELDRLQEVFDDLRGRAAGRLRVAAPSSIIYYHLPPKVQQFHKQFPRVELVLLNRSGPEIIQMVRSGEADVGITFLLDEVSDLRFYPYLPQRLTVLVPNKHSLARKARVTLEEVCRYDQIAFPKTTFQRQLLDRMCTEAGCRLKVVMEVIGRLPAQKYVEMGAGIAILPEIREGETKSRKLTAVPLHSVPDRIVRGVLIRSSRHITASVRSFVKLLDPNITL
jgi:DNA-binding transcriptional LysR family regulator